MKKVIVGIILCFILSISLYVRNYNLTVWPRNGATFDEYAWTWLGISIIDTGVPMSWSRHLPYKLQSKFIDKNGASYVLSTPYMEHPPLFGIVAGGFAKIMGATTFDSVTLHNIRPLALILGVMTVLLVFIFGSILFGNGVGLLASALYAVIPTVVVGSRILQNENFFIPLFLLSLICVEKYLKNIRGKYSSLWFIGILILNFMLPLAKIPWIAAPLACMGLFLYVKKYREMIFVGLITTISLGLYIIWGLKWDSGVFLGLMKLQTARYDISFDGFLSIVTNPIITDRIYTDGWIYFGWIAIMLLAINNWKKSTPLLFGFLAYTGVYLLGIPNEAGHGWYRYPFYPFLIIAIAWSIKKYFLTNGIFSFSFLCLVGLTLLQHLWVPKFGFSYVVYRVYIFLSAGICLTTLVTNNKWTKLFSKIGHLLLLIVLLYLSYKAGLRYNEQ